MLPSKTKKRNGRLYYIEEELLSADGRMELFTWDDACCLVEEYRNTWPNAQLVIREFDLISSKELLQ